MESVEKQEWFALMLRSGYCKTVEIMRGRRYYVEETWECRRDLFRDFVMRMALIGSEDGHAALIAKQVMVALYQAGYEIDLIRFGELVGMLCVNREAEKFSDVDLEAKAYAVGNF